MGNSLSIQKYIGDTLISRAPAWRPEFGPEEFLKECEFHGVAALMAKRSESSQNLPDQITEELLCFSNEAKLLDKLQVSALAELSQALYQREIPFIVLKGAALASYCYESSHLRPRTDTDILVNPTQSKMIEDALRDLGYSKIEGANSWGTPQTSFTKDDSFGHLHRLDVHFEISQRVVFSKHFDWGELLRESEVHNLSETVVIRTLNPIYALLHACLHRANHLYGFFHVGAEERSGDRLIWLYDIWILCESLSEGQWNSFAEMCQTKKMVMITKDALHATLDLFESELIDSHLHLFQTTNKEPSAEILKDNQLKRTLADFTAVEGLANRCLLIFRLLFPQPALMRQQYDYDHPIALLWLYPKRIVSRLLKQLA